MYSHTNQTKLTPATSKEMREAIKALLMLGDAPPADSQLALDDNALYVPITGVTTANIPIPVGEHPNNTNREPTTEPIVITDASTINAEEETPKPPQQPPLLGIVLGMVIKTDLDDTDENAIKPEQAPVRRNSRSNSMASNGNIRQQENSSAKFVPWNYQVSRSSTNTFLINIHPSCVLTVPNYSPHHALWQNTGTCMQNSCMNVKTVGEVLLIRANWNPTVKCT